MNRDDRIAFRIRDAARGDESHILALLGELAAYEKMPPLALTEEKIARDMLEPGRACSCHLLVAGTEPVGIAVWYTIYRSFPALRGVYVEDLYVQPQFRGQGGGKLLLAHMARIARGENGFLEWRALDWNKPARDFYEGLGAVAIPEWIGYRLHGDALERLCL
jgi:GNAT superfamily N-acetyltransferase